MFTDLSEKAAADGGTPRVSVAPQDSLRHGEVHLWCGRIESSVACVNTTGDLFDKQWTRVRGSAEGRAREAFFAARKALRALLGHYSGQDPRHLRFAHGASGKPYLLLPDVRQPLHFNLSHTDGLFGIAIASTGELGFDVEHLDGGRSDLFALADQILTPGERAEWAGLPAEQRQRAVLRYWTRKEAMLKASGSGLSVSPDTVEVGWRRAPKGWTLHSLAPTAGYIACLAASWPIWRLERRWLMWEDSDDAMT